MSLDAELSKLEKRVKKSAGTSRARTAAAEWILEQGEEEATRLLKTAPYSWFIELVPLVGGRLPQRKQTVPNAVRGLLAALVDVMNAERTAKLCSWHCGDKVSVTCMGKYSVCGGVCVCCPRTPAPARASERPAPERSLRLRLTLAVLLRAQEHRPSLLYGRPDLRSDGRAE